jgi:high-affinity Fe2+/Pb2+ permease
MSSEAPMISSETPMISSGIPMISSTNPPSTKEECQRTIVYYVVVIFLVLGLLMFIFSGILIYFMLKENEGIDNKIWLAFVVGIIMSGVSSYVIHIEEKKRKEKCKN